MELKCDQLAVSDFIPTNVENIFHPWFFCLFFFFFFAVDLMKNLKQSLMVFSTIFHELMKLRSFEWLNSNST